MQARAFVIGFLVILFWLAPNPSHSQGRTPRREGVKLAPVAPVTTLPVHPAR